MLPRLSGVVARIRPNWTTPDWKLPSMRLPVMALAAPWATTPAEALPRAAAFDERRAVRAGLAGAVDGDGVADGWQGLTGGAADLDRLHARADAEVDHVGAGMDVGVEDGLAQRARAAVGDVGDRERTGAS